VKIQDNRRTATRRPTIKINVVLHETSKYLIKLNASNVTFYQDIKLTICFFAV